MKQLGFVLGIVLAACSPEKSDSETADASTGPTSTGPTSTGPTSTADPSTGDASSTTDASSTGETTPTTSEPTTGPVDPGDFGEMEACTIDQVCDTFLHKIAEGSPYHSEDIEGFLDVEKCILGGLRDGTPGRYVYGIDDHFTNGDSQVTYLIHVHADRSVTFARHAEGTTFPPDMHSETYAPAQTCTLADPAVFTTCLTDNDGFEHYDCMDIATWWTGCAAMGPRCE